MFLLEYPQGDLELRENSVGEESRKSFLNKLYSGFFYRYMGGETGLDVGFSGYLKDVIPILPTAIGVDTTYPGYDGKTLPFPDQSQDYVYSSHVLEHIEDYKQAIREWYRVTKIGGYIVTVVPHRDLYEKKLEKPSRWNGDHKRFYKTSDIIREFEESLPINSFRVRYLEDCDKGFDYSIPEDQHSCGQYEICLVVERIK